jgi:group II intron reverse transcriptase/maturase
MDQAFRAVKRNRGAAGIDQVSINMFEANLENNLAALQRDLKTRGVYQPLPLRRKYIPKGPGKTRPLGIPAVRDRVAQEVVRRLLSPIFEPMFHDDSYGFRDERNCHQALERLLDLHAQGYLVVLDADIQGFFDNLRHSVIMQFVREEVADGNILDLIERFLTSGVMEYGVFKPTTIGTPQGGVISPLLANIVLNQLDWKLHDAGYRLVRYADDFVVVCRTRIQAEEALAVVQRVVAELGLELSPEKTEITTYGNGYEFLGFVMSSCSRRMRPKSVEKYKDKVRELTTRHHNLDAKVIEKLNRVIRGTAQYFATSFSTCRQQFRHLDSWTRMRLRCMALKRKRRGDNGKLRVRYFRAKLGLLCLEDFYPGKPRYVT